MRQPELNIKRARGFLLIVAILVLVVIAVAIAAMGNMTSADVRSSSGHAQSEQAYFAATSGIEYAKSLFLTGTPCAAAAPPAGLLTTGNVGNGSFTISSSAPGPLYNVSSSTVDVGGVNPFATTIPVSTMGNYAPFGRITIDSEEMYYKGISGNKFLNVRRGSSNTVAAIHSFGAVVTQGMCNVTVIGTVGGASRQLSASMPLQNYKQGVFTKLTAGAGTQAITGVGFRPTAVVFYWTRQTATGRTAGVSFGYGFATAANQYAAESDMIDNSGRSRNGRRSSAGNSIIFQDNTTPTPLLLAQANLQSMDTDGFTLKWTTNDAVAYRIYYVALGGDTDASASNFNMTNAAGNQSVTGIGFKPDFVMFIHAGDGSVDTNASDGEFGIGFATSASARGAMVYAGQTNVNNNIRPGWLQQTNRAVLFLNHGTTPPTAGGQADFVSMDSDGFTINVTAVPGGANWNVGYLALRGARFFTGAFNQPTATGTQAITGLGFDPSGVMLVTANLASGAGIASTGRTSLGMAGGSGIVQGNIWAAEQNTVNTGNTNEFNDASNIISTGANVAVPANTAQANLQSAYFDGFSLNWSLADASADQILYWALGPRSFADVIELY